MQNFDIVGALAFFTIGAVLVFGIISWTRAKKAKDHHEGAAVADRQRMDDGLAVRDQRSTDPDSTLPPGRVAPTDGGRSWSKERGANPPTPTTQTPPD